MLPRGTAREQPIRDYFVVGQFLAAGTGTNATSQPESKMTAPPAIDRQIVRIPEPFPDLIAKHAHAGRLTCGGSWTTSESYCKANGIPLNPELYL